MGRNGLELGGWCGCRYGCWGRCSCRLMLVLMRNGLDLGLVFMALELGLSLGLRLMFVVLLTLVEVDRCRGRCRGRCGRWRSTITVDKYPVTGCDTDVNHSEVSSEATGQVETIRRTSRASVQDDSISGLAEESNSDRPEAVRSTVDGSFTEGNSELAVLDELPARAWITSLSVVPGHPRTDSALFNIVMRSTVQERWVDCGIGSNDERRNESESLSFQLHNESVK